MTNKHVWLDAWPCSPVAVYSGLIQYFEVMKMIRLNQLSYISPISFASLFASVSWQNHLIGQIFFSEDIAP